MKLKKSVRVIIFQQNSAKSQEKILNALLSFHNEGWQFISEIWSLGGEGTISEGGINFRQISTKIDFINKTLIDILIPVEAVVMIMDGWNTSLKDVVKNGKGNSSRKKSM
jgi:hypothetical protein